jgi:alpha-beta hydrolase superfamily lysophospholipase
MGHVMLPDITQSFHGSTRASPPPDRAPSFHAASSSLELLNVLGFSLNSLGSEERDQLSQQLNRGKSLFKSFQALAVDAQVRIRQKVGGHLLEKILAISQNRDEELFWEDAVHFAMLMEKGSHQESQTQHLYSWLLKSVPQKFTELHRCLQSRRDALLGVGALGPRLEVWSRRLFYEVADGPTLLGLAGAQGVFNLTRIGIMGWLGSTAPLARFLASGAAMLTEGPAFVGIHHEISRVLGEGSIRSTNLAEEILHTYRTLGTLRLFGSAAYLGIKHIPPSFGSLLPATAMYAGILAGNLWDESKSGNSPRSISDLAFSSLATFVQFQATGHLLNRLAPGLSAWNRELEIRGEEDVSSSRRRFLLDQHLVGTTFPLLGPQEAFADLPALQRLSSAVIEDATPNLWMAKASSTLRGVKIKKGTVPTGTRKSRPADVIHCGPIGDFAWNTIEGVRTYIPLVKPRYPPTSPKGTMILISGLSSNHTRFGELPRLLAEQGWRVRVLVYPGFEVMDENSFLKGFRPKDLARHWKLSIAEATKKIAMSHDPDTDLYIGGYSMGGAGAAAFAFGNLPTYLQERVSGLILAAPAFHTTYFETPSKFRNWSIRHVVVPALAFSGKSYKKISKYNSEIGEYVESSTIRPWSVDYAAVLFNESAREVVSKFQGRKILPRVLLVHTGEGDPVVAPRAAEFVKQVFGNRVEREIVIPAEDGHYMLVGAHRSIAHEGILEFVEKPAVKK